MVSAASDKSAKNGGTVAARSTHSQTLSRGIQALEVLSESTEALTIAEVSERLGLHRSVAYRILRTLEDHGLVTRDSGGRMRLGPGLAALARGVSRDLQVTAQPELSRIAERFGVTAFIGVHDRTEAVTLLSVEPRIVHASVAQRPGARHAVNRGATGIAILAGVSDDDLAAIAEAGLEIPDERIAKMHELGYAVSHDEVIPGLMSVAVPLLVPGEPMAMALSVVSITEIDDVELVADSLLASATRIARAVA